MIERDRLIEKYGDLKNAYNRLTEGLKLVPDDSIIIDGVIQRFEFTFELSWKLLKAYLEYQGYEGANSPRSTIKIAFQNNILKDGDGWIDMMVDRNKMSHIYDEEEAKSVYQKIKKEHYQKIQDLINYMEEFI